MAARQYAETAIENYSTGEIFADLLNEVFRADEPVEGSVLRMAGIKGPSARCGG